MCWGDHPLLADGLVEVWAVHTLASSAVVAQCRKVLSPDEACRAARFRFEHLRKSFIMCRGVFRILLGRYLQTAPASLRFSYGSRGKPALAGGCPLHFSISRSGSLALFAFTLDREIGVDLEQIRPLAGMQELAARFFCREEADELQALDPKQRQRAFFLCWTRKEAYIKATGCGLSEPLDRFRVTLQPDKPARFIHVRHDVNEASAWSLHDLEVDSDYAAALAYRDAPRMVQRIRYLRFSNCRSD